MSLTTRERGAYTRGPYIRVEKRVTNLGAYIRGSLYTGGRLIYGVNVFFAFFDLIKVFFVFLIINVL